MRPVQFNPAVKAVLAQPQPVSAKALNHDRAPRHDDITFSGTNGRTGLILTTLFLGAIGAAGVWNIRQKQQAANPVVNVINPPEVVARPPEPVVTGVITKPGQAEPVASILYNAQRNTLDVFAGNGKTNNQWDPTKYKGEVTADGMVCPILGIDHQTGAMMMSNSPVYILDPNGFFRALGSEKKAPGQPTTIVSLRLGEVDDAGIVHRFTRIQVSPSQPGNPQSDTVVKLGPTEVVGSIQRTDGRPLDKAYRAAAAYAALVVGPDYQNPFLRPGRLEDIPNVERLTIGK